MLLCIGSGILGSGILLRSRQLLPALFSTIAPALFYLRPSIVSYLLPPWSRASLSTIAWLWLPASPYHLRPYSRPCISEITASMLKTQKVIPLRAELYVADQVLFSLRSTYSSRVKSSKSNHFLKDGKYRLYGRFASGVICLVQSMDVRYR